MLNTNQFHFHKDEKTLTADASDLRDNFGETFELKSSHTNRVVTFKFSHLKKDFSGEDIMFWVYVPFSISGIELAIKQLPKVDRVVIYND